MPDEPVITAVAVVATADSDRTTYQANGWTVDSDNQLDVITTDGVIVASYAPGAWRSVFDPGHVTAPVDG